MAHVGTCLWHVCYNSHNKTCRRHVPTIDMEFKEFLEEWRGATPYIAARTSGSTGEPKNIMLDKEFVRQSALRTNSFFCITKDSLLHSCVAADYIGGKMMAVRSEMAGCNFTWEKPSNRPLKDINADERIDLLAVVPSQMIHILDNLDKMPAIEAVIIGGSAINPILYQRICESGLNAYETYGMTETASHVALRKIVSSEGVGDSGEIAFPEWFETLDGISVEKNEKGCLVINFDSGQKFITNDLAEVRDRSHFKITGRYDHIILTGGKKVNPYEVEKKLSPFIGSPFVVSSVPDYKWGNAVVIKVEDGGKGNDDDELMLRMRKILQPHEMPKAILHVKALLRTPNGKILRN